MASYLSPMTSWGLTGVLPDSSDDRRGLTVSLADSSDVRKWLLRVLAHDSDAERGGKYRFVLPNDVMSAVVAAWRWTHDVMFALTVSPFLHRAGRLETNRSQTSCRAESTPACKLRLAASQPATTGAPRSVAGAKTTELDYLCTPARMACASGERTRRFWRRVRLLFCLTRLAARRDDLREGCPFESSSS
jgi:hypothetical protein